MNYVKNKSLATNGYGYPDPTALKAITNISDEGVNVTPEDDERHRKMMGCIFRLCEIANYHLESRIVLRDLNTGKVYR